MLETPEIAFRLGILSHMDKVLQCESPAEIRFLPILLNVCKKLNMKFVCQETVEYPCDYYDWVYEKYGGVLPDWLEGIHEQECGVGCNICNYWRMNELYRIDFVVTKKNTSLNVAIEIDGKKYHNKKDDKVRDNVLTSTYGYRMYRLPVDDVYCNPLEVEETLIDFFKTILKRDD
jgi:hypothetical protein